MFHLGRSLAARAAWRRARLFGRRGKSGPCRPVGTMSRRPSGPLARKRGTGPSTGTPYCRLERDAPAVDLAGIAPAAVGHAQLPRAVEGLARQVTGVGLDDVVGAAAGAVVHAVHAAIRRDQVHLQVADIGVLDVHAHRAAGRGVAAAAGHRDRAVRGAVVADRVVAAVAVGLRAAIVATAVVTATVTGRVVAQDAHARERRIALDPHVVRTGGRRAEAAALAVAGLVRAAVVGAVGRRAAELHVQVGITAAA